MTNNTQAILFVLPDWGGHHPAAWREKGVSANPPMDFDMIRRFVQTAERGKFHALFLADSPAVGMLGQGVGNVDALARTCKATRPEPLTLLSSLATYTTHIGLVATASTTYAEPYNVARQFGTLDFISGGRAGWNVVATTSNASAQNFGREEHMAHEARYERAQEFTDIVTGLWDSWDDDAFLCDKDSGRFFDPSKMHSLDYRGKYLASAGPLNVPRTPQGYPVIVQAGSSTTGLDFAARNAEVVFTVQKDPAKGKAFYTELKEKAAAFGRDPRHVKVLSGFRLLVGRSEAEAKEKLARLNSLLDPEHGREMVQIMLGRDLDLSKIPLDAPFPDIPKTEAGSHGAQQTILDMVKRDNLTLRQVLQRFAGGNTDALTPTTAADMIEASLKSGVTDGFNLQFGDEFESLEVFVDEVVPELQRRGLFHTEYQGKTLRENLGLPRPASRYAASR